MSLEHSPVKDTRQAANYVGLSGSTLAKLRMRGEGPVFVRLSRKKIVYRVQDLDQWLEDSRRTSTSDNC